MPKHMREGQYILSRARTVWAGSQVLKTIKPNTECLALTEYGVKLESTIGYKLNYLNLNSIYLTPDITGLYELWTFYDNSIPSLSCILNRYGEGRGEGRS